MPKKPKKEATEKSAPKAAPKTKKKAAPERPRIPRDAVEELFKQLREVGYLVRDKVPHEAWKTDTEVPPEAVYDGQPYVFLNEIYNDAWKDGWQVRSVSLQLGYGGVPWGQPVIDDVRRVIALASELGWYARGDRSKAQVWLHIAKPA